MNKKIIFSLAVGLLLIPLGVSLAAVSTDKEFNIKAQEMRSIHNAFKEARSQAATPELANANANINTSHGKTKDQILENRATHRKTTLQKIIDIQIAYFNRVQERINNMPNISDDEKTNLTSQVTTALAGLEVQKTGIDATSNDDILITKAKDLCMVFMGYRETVKAIVSSIHASRVAGAEDTTGDRASAIEMELDALAADGKDVTVLKIELATAQTYIDDTKTLREAGDYKGAVSKLKEAYSIFRSVLQAAKKL
ncbi:hypothetical protein K8R42_04665 [bacterium]|nr:hypothetical protein [bacterium]